MFNALGDVWNQQQQSLADQGLRPGQMDTAGIAGKLILSGVLPKDAYVQAAQIFHGQEQNNLQKQKQDQRQQQLAAASQIIKQGGGLADLLAAGVSDPGILGALPQPQWVPNKGNPAGGQFVTPGQMPGAPQSGMQAGGGMSNQLPQPQLGGTPLPMNQNNQSQYDQFDTSELGVKEATKLKGKRAASADEYVRDITDQASKASDTVQTIRQLKVLIPQLFTGNYAEEKEKLSRGLGVNQEAVEAHEQFDATVTRLVDELEQQKKSGRATDAAAKIIIGSKPKKGNIHAANLSIANALEARGVAIEEKAEALDKWKAQGRDPNSFEQVWNSYERKNPFMTIGKKGHIQINEKNLVKWRKDIFGEEIGETQEKETPELSTNNIDRKEQIRQILRKRGEL